MFIVADLVSFIKRVKSLFTLHDPCSLTFIICYLEMLNWTMQVHVSSVFVTIIGNQYVERMVSPMATNVL